jgi:hypothetical protein
MLRLAGRSVQRQGVEANLDNLLAFDGGSTQRGRGTRLNYMHYGQTNWSVALG